MILANHTTILGIDGVLVSRMIFQNAKYLANIEENAKS